MTGQDGSMTGARTKRRRTRRPYRPRVTCSRRLTDGRLPHMALLGRKKTTIGLDIGSGLVKVAVIDHGRSEPELTKVAIAPLLADAIVEGEIMDPAIVAEASRNAWSRPRSS